MKKDLVAYDEQVVVISNPCSPECANNKGMKDDDAVTGHQVIYMEQNEELEKRYWDEINHLKQMLIFLHGSARYQLVYPVD